MMPASPRTDEPAAAGIIHVCASCAEPAGSALTERIEGMLGGQLGRDVAVRRAPCMGACDRRIRACLVGEGRWSWLFGDLDPAQDLADLALFVERWLAAPDGTLAKEARPPGLRRHLIGRVPPINRHLP